MTEPTAGRGSYRRSVNRCHLLSRIPISEINGVTRLYYLEFTSGNMLVKQSLEPRHVYHVLHGFLIRRSLSEFVGQNGSAMIALPLCRDLLTLKDKYPTGRLVVHIRQQEEPALQNRHLVMALRRAGVRFACDLECLNSPQGWREQVSSFDFLVIHYSAHYLQDLGKAFDLKRFNPRLRIITTGVDSLEQRQQVLELGGTDLVLSFFMQPHTFYSDKKVLLHNANLFALIKEISSTEPDFERVVDRIVRRHPYMQRDVINLLKYRDPNFKERKWQSALFVQRFGTEWMRCVLSICALHGLAFLAANGGDPFAKNAAFEPLKTALIRGYFMNLMAREIKLDQKNQSLAFVYGLFSLERVWASLLNPKLAQTLLSMPEQITDLSLFDMMLECVIALEQVDLNRFVRVLMSLNGTVGFALHYYEEALLWSNDIVAILYSTNYSDFTVTLALPSAEAEDDAPDADLADPA